jgi:alpha-glucosidase
VDAEADVLAYVRRHPDGEGGFLVALNLGSAPQTPALPDAVSRGVVALSTHLDREGERVAGALALRPDEGVIVRLAEAS